MTHVSAMDCICVATLALIAAAHVPTAFRYLRAIPSRIREHDARARANRRRRELDEAAWKGIERRAELQTGIHRRMRGAQ